MTSSLELVNISIHYIILIFRQAFTGQCSLSGMDPAGPEFVSVDDRTIGLWTDCAAFVDTLNTDQALGDHCSISV